MAEGNIVEAEIVQDSDIDKRIKQAKFEGFKLAYDLWKNPQKLGIVFAMGCAVLLGFALVIFIVFTLARKVLGF